MFQNFLNLQIENILFFFIAVEYFIVQICYSSLNQYPTDRHQGCFQSLATAKMLQQKLLYTLLHEYTSTSAINFWNWYEDKCVNALVFFQKLPICFLWGLYHFALSLQIHLKCILGKAIHTFFGTLRYFVHKAILKDVLIAKKLHKALCFTPNCTGKICSCSKF